MSLFKGNTFVSALYNFRVAIVNQLAVLANLSRTIIPTRTITDNVSLPKLLQHFIVGVIISLFFLGLELLAKAVSIVVITLGE
jgi:hypothetical protein